MEQEPWRPEGGGSEITGRQEAYRPSYLPPPSHPSSSPLPFPPPSSDSSFPTPHFTQRPPSVGGYTGPSKLVHHPPPNRGQGFRTPYTGGREEGTVSFLGPSESALLSPSSLPPSSQLPPLHHPPSATEYNGGHSHAYTESYQSQGHAPPPLYPPPSHSLHSSSPSFPLNPPSRFIPHHSQGRKEGREGQVGQGMSLSQPISFHSSLPSSSPPPLSSSSNSAQLSSSDLHSSSTPATDGYVGKILNIKHLRKKGPEPRTGPGAGGKILNAVTNKMEEIKLMAPGRIGYRLEKAQQLLSPAKASEAPSFSFVEYFPVLKKANTNFQAAELEQLFYVYRDLSVAEEMTLDKFVVLLPASSHSNPNLEHCIFSIFCPDGYVKATVGSFVSVLSVMSRGSFDEKLPLLFKLYAHGQIVRFDTMMAINMDIVDMIFSGGGFAKQNAEMKNIVNNTIQKLFAGQPSLNYDSFYAQFLNFKNEFSSHPVDNDYSFFGCFGLFHQLTKGTVQKAITNLRTQPQKEGALVKQYMSGHWVKHWFVLKQKFLYYYKKTKQGQELQQKKLSRVVSLSSADVKYIGEYKEFPSTYSYCFEVSTSGYKRIFSAESEKECNDWIVALQLHSFTITKGVIHSSSYVPRSGINAKWFIDGKDAFFSIFEAIWNAKESIFITDWYLTPELVLLRGDNIPYEYLGYERLNNLLKKKAEEGVRTYVLVWNETKIAVNLNSQHAQKILQGEHKNIKVIRHPLVSPVSWSHHQKIVVVDQEIAFLGGLDLALGRWDDQTHPIMDNDHKLWLGKDYYNPVVGGLDDVSNHLVDYFDRKYHPRMAWHDIHLSVDGLAARDVSANFIERWNHHKDIVKVSGLPWLVPKSTVSKCVGSANVQILRSVGGWSAGFSDGLTETSIYNAYLYHIENAEHFIYIENQFFVSCYAGDPVKNTIVDAIYQRVATAVKSKSVFRVIIVLPLHPDGTFQTSAAVRNIMRLNYYTINRGGSSLLERFAEEFPYEQAEEYFSFNAIRNYHFTNGRPITEQIYVHSKLMIVDDRVVICGSANINDRSMLGDRDSEIGGVITDEKTVYSHMNGRTYMVGYFAHSLRKALWAEHLGLEATDPSIEDPIVEQVYWGIWKTIAANNNDIYMQVFPNTAHDSIESLQELSMNAYESADLNHVELLSRLKGHLVHFPLNFLKGENLEIDYTKNVDLYFADPKVFC